MSRIFAESYHNYCERRVRPAETAKRILAKAPRTVVKLLAQMIYHFGHKINASDEEINDCVRNMGDRDMGELWANMDKMDIQAERGNSWRRRNRSWRRQLRQLPKKIKSSRH